MGGGKDGNIFVVNCDDMGKYLPLPGGSNNVIQAVATGVDPINNIFSTPVYWNNSIYLHCNQGSRIFAALPRSVSDSSSVRALSGVKKSSTKKIESNPEHRIRTLAPRQDLTGADRTWAERYEVGDVLRYSRASKETGIGKGEYAQVKSIDASKNG